MIGSSGVCPDVKATLVDGKAPMSTAVGELGHLELQVQCNILTITFCLFHICI